MDRQDKVNIVVGLVESYIRQDNRTLCQINRTLFNENAALKRRMERMKLVQDRSSEQIQNMLIRIRDLERDVELMDLVAREYFINEPGACARWEPRVSFHDPLFVSLCNARMMFGDLVAFHNDGADELIEEDDDEMTEIDEWLDEDDEFLL